MISIDEIRALCDAATPGPWISTDDAEDGYGASIIARNSPIVDMIVDGGEHGWGAGDAYGVLTNTNAVFIAASRTLIPELLDALNSAQCAHVFVSDSLSYETKRFRDALAEKDAEIERLKAELSQSHASTEKLSRGLWKDC